MKCGNKWRWLYEAHRRNKAKWASTGGKLSNQAGPLSSISLIRAAQRSKGIGKHRKSASNKACRAASQPSALCHEMGPEIKAAPTASGIGEICALALAQRGIMVCG